MKIKTMLWPTKKLGEVCDLIKGSEPGSESYFDETNKERIRFIRVGDISGKVDQPKFIDKKLSNLVVVNPDEILISFDGTPGIVAKGWSGAIASGIRVIRNIKPEILKEFLYYYLQTSEPQKVIKFYTTGVTISHASRAIPYIKIPIPFLNIQQKIVERLDAIKKAQELNDKQIELAEELFQSLLHRELDPKGKNWEVKKLGEICRIEGGDAAPQDKTVFENGTIPFVRMQDLGRYHITTNLIETVDKITNEALKKFRLKIWPKGSILLPRSGSVYMNHRAILSIDACVVSHIAILTNFSKEILNKYLFYYLNILDMSRFGAQTTGIDSISFSQIGRLKIPLPPLETQQKIVEKLSAVQEYKKKLLDQKQKLQELFESVLNKSFKGELI
jgi:restriction endonuclease S subunit